MMVILPQLTRSPTPLMTPGLTITGDVEEGSKSSLNWRTDQNGSKGKSLEIKTSAKLFQRGDGCSALRRGDNKRIPSGGSLPRRPVFKLFHRRLNGGRKPYSGRKPRRPRRPHNGSCRLHTMAPRPCGPQVATFSKSLSSSSQPLLSGCQPFHMTTCSCFSSATHCPGVLATLKSILAARLAPSDSHFSKNTTQVEKKNKKNKKTPPRSRMTSTLLKDSASWALSPTAMNLAKRSAAR